MKIKKIEVCGFKSFVDRTVLMFDHDITGVVGPNGCGKSNIVDAIRWAMGEMSAKHLRGSSMEDVIFNGAESRGPSGFAEVTLTFENDDGNAPPEYANYAEIAVTRRLDRQGNSEYQINRTPVRLMDITNLFLGTGVGKRAYSIIEQGRIGYIVSSKPGDRRHIIEEAAGITKFKARKRSAERKMDQTRQNLLRVSDIIQEIERSLASLKRQAQKAERYKRYRNEMRDLELHVASHRWLELHGEQRVVSGELNRASAMAEGQRSALRVREAEFEAERVALHVVERDAEHAQTRAYELDNEVKLLESKIAHHLDRLTGLREREAQMERELAEVSQQRVAFDSERETLKSSLSDLEARERDAADALTREMEGLDRLRVADQDAATVVANSQRALGDSEARIARAEAVLTAVEQRRQERREHHRKLVAEQEDLQRRIVETEQEASAFTARLEALNTGREAQTKKREEIAAELETLRGQLKGSDQSLEALRDEVAERRSRLRSLMEIQSRFEGVGMGVRALMTRFAGDEAARQAAGVIGLLADRVECDAELTRALAASLGERLTWIVVEQSASASNALNWLRDEGDGRATLVPREFPRGPHALRVDSELLERPGVIGRLVDRVRSADEDAPIVNRLLADVLVVNDMATALDVVGQSFDGTVVTLDGELVAPDGSMTGGASDEGGEHMLEVKREIRELTGVVSDLEQRLESAITEHGELKAGISANQSLLDTARTEAHDSEIAIVTADKDLEQANDAVAQGGRRLEELAIEFEQVSRNITQADEEEQAGRVEVADAGTAREQAQQELSAAEEVHRERRAAIDAQSASVTEVRVFAAQARERAEGDRGSMERLRRSLEELDGRQDRLRNDLADGARQQGWLMAELLGDRESLSENVKAAMAAHDALTTVRGRYDEDRNRLAVNEEELKALRSEIEVVTQSANDLVVREREVSLALEHLLEQVADRHRVDLPRVLGDYHDREIPDASTKGRIDELIRLIERMGEINLTAIEEYEEKSERHEYLTSQRADLEDALTQLERAIRQMNRESRRLFKEAFTAVNERFRKVFPTMFGGGKAELRLTDPEDLLESGVDIFAQPPGKRLGSLELMSGGEKALTAVSLIFAIFQYKPSPFCLLDEVDAPLDEANIGRFADAVRQMTERSQFILITHAKRTMECADVLYGVTMETPGISKIVSVELTGHRKRPADGDTKQTAQSAAVA